MEKSSTTIRNSIIATVVGGVILWFLLKAWVWVKLKQAGVWVWNALWLDVTAPLWFLGTLGVLVIALFSVQLYKRKNIPRGGSNFQEAAAPPAAEPALSAQELDVLHCLTQADGDMLELEAIAGRTGISRLRTEHALYQLEQRGLINAASGYEGPTVYDLTDGGRDRVIALGMA